jgi:lincosamide nucleotidyltransferase A/C/D/E
MTVSAEDVIKIYDRLSTNGIPVWLTGGWGIDALLGKQTRPHKDVDLILSLVDIARMRELLGLDGYFLKEIWSENRRVMDANKVETATAFVLQDPDGRECDAHAISFDALGNGIPAWDDFEGLIFSKKDLSGEGRIAGVAIPCISPEMQIICHSGYALPDKQLRDLELLHEKFGVGFPDEYFRDRSAGA